MTTVVGSISAAVAASNVAALAAVKVYRPEEVPETSAIPRIVVYDGISAVASLRGDARNQAWRKLVQVSLFQHSPGDDSLLPALIAALNGARDRGRTMAVESWARLTENPAGDVPVIHHPLTVRVQTRTGA